MIKTYNSKLLKCIWCERDSIQTMFKNKAHTMPKSLGGINILKNICDECNSYFGSSSKGLPSIEVAFKEPINFSKYYLLFNIERKNWKRKWKSQYFHADWEKGRIKLKTRYKLKPDFEILLGRQLRKVFYKVYLEERHRQLGDAFNSRFNFIREFCRYNKGDYPVFRFIPRIPGVYSSNKDLEHPTFRFTRYSKELDKKFRVYVYPLVGHNFCIPTVKDFDMNHLTKYLLHIKKTKDPYGVSLKEIISYRDLDISFSENKSNHV